ncbi:hypothetical protein [Streptomyces cylindrosporus]|uniref:Uncharacterized protein n=1 Tax=Streptomyces cylindrosporus TaxID=2927583 RepID=A0ABS9YLP6_9ACTN|nr:hypothetical protein [Streptomyces cylindrosporus]MCI3276766.1 hypothetical protein [Streptomyces cylindrosporus]
MARLHLRSGMDPDAPKTAYAVLVVDPEGTPGERAVAALGSCCYEGDGAFYLVRSDGWAERSPEDGRLAVRIAVHPAVLRQVGVDPEDFPGRSSVDPRALLVLEARAAADPALTAHLAEPTAVFTAGPDTTLEELLASDAEWPMFLAPPPES